jgi:hypothetical protein
MFNFLHSSLQNVIERAFGVLKQKWRILKGIPSFPTHTQKHIIIACMALHNFIRDSNSEDKLFDRCDADEEYLDTWYNRVSRYKHKEMTIQRERMRIQ